MPLLTTMSRCDASAVQCSAAGGRQLQLPGIMGLLTRCLEADAQLRGHIILAGELPYHPKTQQALQAEHDSQLHCCVPPSVLVSHTR